MTNDHLVHQKPSPSPLEAFTGEIGRKSISPLYSAGLVVVAFAMVLLPTMYILLIALAAWGVLYHLTHNAWIMTGSGGAFIKLMVYLGPAIVGSILVFFMFKPLLAKRSNDVSLPSFDPQKEPLLFAFVERICQMVGSSKPARIEMDCQVNASARLKRGLFSKDLVLTIGIPLAAGLNMREFAGVLAHEFGHFTQGFGMRLTYIIRNINLWFARVVYERDEWDLKLERSARTADYRIGIVLHTARGCVWVTRRILWALMQAGNAISCFMMRQMEYDADWYETNIAGSDAFETTSARLRILNIASQIASGEVQQSWASHKLPENLPYLINHKASSLGPDVAEKISSANASEKTKWFHTHPSDTDRIRAARGLNRPGIFRLQEAATELFSDFGSISKAVTKHVYEQSWKLEFSEQNLVSSEEMIREGEASAEFNAAIRTFYGEVNISLVPLLQNNFSESLGNANEVMKIWTKAKQDIENRRKSAEQASLECARFEQRLLSATSAYHLTGAGFSVSPAEFGLPEYAKSVGEQETAAKFAIEETTNDLKQEVKKIEGYVSSVRKRVLAVLQMQTDRDTSGDQSAETKTLCEVLSKIGSVMPAVRQIGIRIRAFTVLAGNRNNHTNPVTVDRQMETVANELNQLLKEVDLPLEGIKYPFAHPRGELTVIEYMSHGKKCDHTFEQVFKECSSRIERLFALHYRLMGRILVIAAEAEKDVGQKELTPQPSVHS